MKAIYLSVKSISFLKALCNEVLEMKKNNCGIGKVVNIIIDELKFLNWDLDIHSSGYYQKEPILIAKKGNNNKEKIVVTADMFLKSDTSVTLVNGGGLVSILILAELLNNYSFERQIEFVIFENNNTNGSLSMQGLDCVLIKESNNPILNIDIGFLGVKADEIALSISKDALSLNEITKNVLREYQDIKKGSEYVSNNNAFFTNQGISAISFGSIQKSNNSITENAFCLPCNDVDNVDCRKIIDIAQAVQKIIEKV